MHHALLTSRQAALQTKFSCQCDRSAKFLSLWTFLPNPQPRQPRHNRHSLHAHADHLANQPHNILRILGAVRIVDNAAALVGFNAVLVEHPVQRRAVAEAVGERFGGDAVQRQETVVAQLRFVFGEAHFLDAPVERHLRRFDLLERVLRLLFIADVEGGQARAGAGEGAEVGREGDARQLALEVGLVAFAVGGMVQQAVDVVEDVPLADRVVAVLGAELRQRPVGDVLAAVAAVLVVGVEGEALESINSRECVQVGNRIRHQSTELCAKAVITNNDYSILCFGLQCGEDGRKNI